MADSLTVWTPLYLFSNSPSLPLVRFRCSIIVTGFLINIINWLSMHAPRCVLEILIFTKGMPRFHNVFSFIDAFQFLRLFIGTNLTNQPKISRNAKANEKRNFAGNFWIVWQNLTMLAPSLSYGAKIDMRKGIEKKTL